VVTERVRPVSAHFAVTVTPGSTAPVASATDPVISPVVFCAYADVDPRARLTAIAKTMRKHPPERVIGAFLFFLIGAAAGRRDGKEGCRSPRPAGQVI
jgi:hypothetical protein